MSLKAAEVAVLPDLQAVAREAARLWAVAADTAVTDRGVFRAAVSGSRTPEALFSLLSEVEFRGLPWDRTEVFWVDERCVTPEDPASNYGQADRLLFEKVPVAEALLHPMFPAGGRPIEAAQTYDRLLKERGLDHGGFDFCQLGVGDDGHTASLFPGSPALEETARLAVHACSPAGVRDRITLTLPLLNRSRLAVFLVAGEAKAGILRRVLQEDVVPALPAQRVRPAGRLLYLVDRAAAAAL